MTPIPTARPNRQNLWIALGFGLATLWSCICLAGAALTSEAAVQIQSGPPRPTAMPLPQIPEADMLIQGISTAPFPVLIAEPTGTLHLFWYEDEAGGMGLRHRRMDSNGGWSSPEGVTEGLIGDIYDPPNAVVHPDGSVCVFWLGKPLSDEFLAPRGIYWRCIRGEHWFAVESAPGPQDSYGEKFLPGFRADGQLVFAYLRTDQTLYVGDQRISEAGGRVNRMQLAVDSSGGCHLAWSADRSTVLHYRYAPDCMDNWQADAPLTGSGSEFPPGATPVFELRADHEGNVHAAWAGADSLYYRRRNSDGNWTPVESVYRETGLFPFRIAIAMNSGGKPRIAWVQSIPKSYTTGLFYSLRRGEGAWDGPSLIASTTSGTTIEYPGLAAENLRLYFIWQEDVHTGQPEFNLNFLSLSDRAL
jgi:hypothetical protein